MEDNYNFCDNAPANFGFCFNAECTAKGKCMRALAARDLTTSRTYVSVVNPLLVDAAAGEKCAYFKKAEKIRLAFGFKKALAQVAYGRVGGIMPAVCQYVCRRDYYYLRKGEKPLSPAMQKRVEAIFKRCGLQEPMEFDRYEWDYDW